MKDKFNRAVATGLIALMIANFVACDEYSPISNDINNDTNSGYSNSDTSNVNDNSFAKGGIWYELTHNRSIFTNTKNPYTLSELSGLPIPLTFLEERGVIIYDSLNRPRLTTERQPDVSYSPFRCFAFVDDNSKENDVYLLLQFKNDVIAQNKDNDNVHLATWQLKYTLSDDDYQTFLKLNNDWRIAFFVQEMDRQYEPEVISESIVCQDLIFLGSHVRNESLPQKRQFPYIFPTNVDYDNLVVTFGSVNNEGIKYIDVNLRDSIAWDLAITEDGYSEDEVEDLIQVETAQTPIGPSLTKFHVNYRRAGLTQEQAAEAFENTTNIAKLRSVNINMLDSVYTMEEVLK
jgi:hypothetical protein